MKKKVFAVVIVGILVSTMALAAVRNRLTDNVQIVGSPITIEAGKTFTKTIKVCDPNGAWPTNAISLKIHSTEITNASLGSLGSIPSRIDPNCPQCNDPNNDFWASATLTITPTDYEVGQKTIWFAAEDQQGVADVNMRNQDYKKLVVNVIPRVDSTPPCIVGF